MSLLKSSIYRAWVSMRNRCFDEKNKSFKNYGGRGITVCDRWLVYINFRDDMGEKPNPKYSLDRIDVNGNYEPGNCRWATPQQQAYNRRCARYVTIEGVEYRAVDLSKEYKKRLTTIIERAERGLSFDEVVSEERIFELSDANRQKMTNASVAKRLSETHCLNGHPWTPETTRILSNTGNRRCLICLRAAEKRTSERRSGSRRATKIMCD